MPCEVEAAINADYPLFLSGLREAPQGEYNIITIILSILCSIVTFLLPLCCTLQDCRCVASQGYRGRGRYRV